MTDLNIDWYFNEPRLKMSLAGRIIVRIFIACFYILFGALVVMLLFSGVLSNAQLSLWLGILGLIFLTHRLMHFNEGQKSLLDLRFKSKQKVNTAHYLNPKTLAILEKAMEKSWAENTDMLLYLAKFLLANGDITEAISRMDISLKDFEQKLNEIISQSKNTQKISKKDLLTDIEILVQGGFKNALQNSEKFIEPRNIFCALGRVNDSQVKRLFVFFLINPDDLNNAIIFGRFRKTALSNIGRFSHRPYKIRHRVMNRAWSARPTPLLDKFSSDLTDLAAQEQIGFLIGHEKEYNRLVDILSRASKPNAILVGDPGSGKETIVSHMAFEIIKDKVPEPLFDKRLVQLSIGNLISGAGADEISKRVNEVVQEIAAAGNIILFIPDIHNLSKTSGQQYMSAADVLIPILTSDAFPVIGSTYPKEFKQFIEPQSDFANAFEIIKVDEISEDDAIKFLTYDSVILEARYKIIISFGAIKQTVLLAHKYFRQKLLPSSAEELLKEALADASQRQDKVLQADDITSIAERKINVPIHQATKEEAKRLLNLENIIHERLIDQEQAVKSVSQALREYRSGLSRKGGPIAVFLFVGPTGVGKTELSKILAGIQFGSESMMLRFDMSEYQDKQSINRFIGSPDGKMTGTLTEAVIQKPYCLILLDEFEKAHPDILNLFLQVFDDGRLTDNFGRTIDFTNTIIIATSNAHSEFIKTELENNTPYETISDQLKKKLADYFKPELLNRFSNIIVFKTLSPEDIKTITRLQLQDLSQTISEAQGINLVFDDAVVNKIAELGYNPVFGARPLRAVISDKIRGVLASKILTGEISKGVDVNATLDGEEIKFAT